jgi:hypothetical protein
MKVRLIACVGCQRHVKEDDAACPFCGAATPVAGPLPPALGVRMTRAMMMAAGTAGTVAAILDCGQTSGGTAVFYGGACTGGECIPGGDQDAAPFVFDGGSGAVFYGSACTGDACPPFQEDAATTETSDASGAGVVDASASDAADGSDATGD